MTQDELKEEFTKAVRSGDTEYLQLLAQTHKLHFNDHAKAVQFFCDIFNFYIRIGDNPPRMTFKEMQELHKKAGII